MKELDGAVEAADRRVGLVPENLDHSRFLARVLARRADFLHDAGRVDDARRDVERSLLLYRDLAGREPPVPADMADYAMKLLVCPFEDLRDPKEALCWAERAVAGGGPDGPYTEVLEKAREAVGR